MASDVLRLLAMRLVRSSSKAAVVRLELMSTKDLDHWLVAALRGTRRLRAVLVAHTISDFLQVAYRAAEDQL